MKKSWIEKASSKDRENLLQPVGGIGADGFRMHIGEDAQCLENEKISKNFYTIIERTKKECPALVFRIQTRYLLDALSGMGDQVQFFSAGPASPVVIQDPYGHNLAIIMPMVDSDHEIRFPVRPEPPAPIPPMEGGYG